MSAPELWALVGLGLAEVVVRRRSAGVALLAAQTLLLGAIAIGEATGSGDLWVAAAILVVRGLALPALLGLAIRQTREPRRLVSERTALPRLVAAVLVVLLAAALTPGFGLLDHGVAQAAAALVALGIAIAALRRPVVFQAIGFLVAENGVYLASLSVAGGFPAVIELGLVFDLVVILAVAVAFGAKIHEQLGTSDTSLLRSLRD